MHAKVLSLTQGMHLGNSVEGHIDDIDSIPSIAATCFEVWNISGRRVLQLSAGMLDSSCKESSLASFSGLT